MKKPQERPMKKILIVGGFFIVAVATALPYYLGEQAQNRFAQGHEWLQQEMLYPQLSAQAGDFNKGWFTSEASTKFTVASNKEGGKPLEFELVHHITQVPSFGEGALMTIDSELVLPTDATEELGNYFEETPLLRAHTIIKFDGSEESTFTSPSYSGSLRGDKNVRLEWQGLEGSSRMDAETDNISVSITAPLLRFEDNEGKLLIDNLHYDAQLRRGNHQLWFGSSDTSVDKFTLDLDSPKNGPTSVHLNNLTFTSEQRENSRQRVNMDGKLTFDSAEVNGFTVENGIYDAGYSNLDAASLGQINTGLKQIIRRQPQEPGVLITGMLPQLQSLLSRQPELAIRQLKVDTPMGTIHSKMNMALTEEPADQVMLNPAELMNMMKLDIEVSLPKPLLMGIFSTSARNSIMRTAKAQNKTLSEEELNRQVNVVVQQQVQGLLAQKLMVDEGENYATAIHYTPQKLVINEEDVTPIINGLIQQ
ncbi:MAG: YdgA family protein [Pseudomonadota bacterium]